MKVSSEELNCPQVVVENKAYLNSSDNEVVKHKVVKLSVDVVDGLDVCLFCL